jgi:uncharacterized membrane protein
MKFIKTTVIGGIVFLVPIVVFVAVIGKGLEFTKKLAQPLVDSLPVDSTGDLLFVQALAVAILALVCFVAGLLGRTAVARKLVEMLEANVLSKIPAYALMKTKTQSMLSPDDIEDMAPVVVRFDDSWQLAFEIERIESKNCVAVFLPSAPDPWSGSVCVVTADRVKPLDLSIPIAAKIAKRLGRGTSDAVGNRLQPSPHDA